VVGDEVIMKGGNPRSRDQQGSTRAARFTTLTLVSGTRSCNVITPSRCVCLPSLNQSLCWLNGRGRMLSCWYRLR